MNDNPEIHSRRVAWLKLVLPSLALALLGLLVIFSRSGDDIIQLAIFDAAETDGGVVLRDPVMRGVTTDNAPYEIAAQTARSEDAENKLVELRYINARFEATASNSAYTIVATKGFMNNETGIMDLREGVTYRDEAGLVLDLVDLVYDTAQGTGQTQNPVSGVGPQGRFTAQSLQISKTPSVYIFERARLTVDPKASKADQ